MIELGSATEDEMVAAFLRAEINSSRYGQYVQNGLAQSGYDRRLIDNPNVIDMAENVVRKRLLAKYRGYPNTLLFSGFPQDASWRRVRLELRDLEAMRYINDVSIGRQWIELTNGSRLVSDGARNFRERHQDEAIGHITAIVDAVRRGDWFPELIAAEADDGSLVIMEGHSRATAYVMEQFAGRAEALIASSPTMPGWYFY